MAELLQSLGSWFTFFLSIVSRDAGNPAGITTPRLDIVHGFFAPSAAVAQNTKWFVILFVAGPVAIMAAVGLFHRFLGKH